MATGTTIFMMALLLSLSGPSVFGMSHAAASQGQSASLPTVPPSLAGTCTYVDNITLVTGFGTHTSMYFDCSGAPTITSSPLGDTVTFSNGTSRHLTAATSNSKETSSSVGLLHPASVGGNLNYVSGWTSGSCNNGISECTDTTVDDSTTMVPNTPYWGIQDNVYGSNGICGSTMNYQIAAIIGTSANSYANQWGEGYATWPLCVFSSDTDTFYNVLAGQNLNSGIVFETWYTLSSGGYATTAYITFYTPTNTYTYSAAIPSGNPNIAINGWEQVVVCSTNGCTTNFTGGAGSIGYFQNNINSGNPNTTYTTSENSNCNYGTVTINVSGNKATQSYTC